MITDDAIRLPPWRINPDPLREGPKWINLAYRGLLLGAPRAVQGVIRTSNPFMNSEASHSLILFGRISAREAFMGNGGVDGMLARRRAPHSYATSRRKWAFTFFAMFAKEGGCRKVALLHSIGGFCQIRTFAPLLRNGNIWSRADRQPIEPSWRHDQPFGTAPTPGHPRARASFLIPDSPIWRRPHVA